MPFKVFNIIKHFLEVNEINRRTALDCELMKCRTSDSGKKRKTLILSRHIIYEDVFKSFRTESITK
jgi:hypothetical protein